MLRTTSAEAVWSFADGPLSGRPAVTRRELGQGAVWYVGALLDPATIDTVIATAAGGAGLDLAPLPEEIEMIRRGDSVVILNHGAMPARVRVHGRDVEVAGEDLLVLGREG